MSALLSESNESMTEMEEKERSGSADLLNNRFTERAFQTPCLGILNSHNAPLVWVSGDSDAAEGVKSES